MKIKESPWLKVLLIIIGLISLGLKFLDSQVFSPFLLTLGRLHPILLHFPLVLLIVLLAIELGVYFKWLTISPKIRLLTFTCVVASTFVALFSGYFLYASGEYEGFLMESHFNGALATFGFLLLAILLFLTKTEWKWKNATLLICLLGANAAAIYTGHQGGSITHGQGFVSEYLSLMSSKEPFTMNQEIELLYEDVVNPILEAKCASCHNKLRAKGGFSVATYQDLLAKGESGKNGIRPGDLAQSELLQRILLPDTLDEHMPPVGKAQLEAKEIELIRFWIGKGAEQKLSLAKLANDSIQQSVVQITPSLQQYRFQVEKSALNAELLEQELNELALELEVVIKKDLDSEGELYILANTFPPSPFGSEKLEKLKPYLTNFSKLSLVSSQIDDSDLYLISQMKNLEELYLQKTKIKGFGITQLQRLPKLEVLNISYTEADDKALLDIVKFPSLKELFLYSTKTSNDVIKAIGAYKPELRIFAEEGPYL